MVSQEVQRAINDYDWKPTLYLHDLSYLNSYLQIISVCIVEIDSNIVQFYAITQ